jgi:hypothetical protein
MLLSTQLVVCGVARSRSLLCVAPTAVATSRLVAPHRSLLGRVPALSAGTAPMAAAFANASTVAAPIRAAALRELDVAGVVELVKGLRVDSDDCEKLVKQKIDGATLLVASVDDLFRIGVSVGAVYAIVRGIAPAVSEAQKAAAEASAVTLKIYPPLVGGGRNNPIHVKLTPEDFRIKYVLSNAPLQLVSKDGAVLEEVMTLEYAVEAINRLPSATLRWTRSFGDDVRELRGFVSNFSDALEQTTTRALSNNASLVCDFGPLAACNSAEHLTVSLRSGGELLQVIEIDGLVMGASVVCLNSAKHTPSLKNVDEVASDATKLQDMLALHIKSLSTKPPEVKAELVGVSRLPILPYLSGNSFSAAVEAKCREKGVGIVRPSGEGFVVEHPLANRGTLFPRPSSP